MVSKIRLLQIHKRLCEIFGCLETQSFGNLSFLVVGDLFQLPPIKSQQIFEAYNNAFGAFLICSHYS